MHILTFFKQARSISLICLSFVALILSGCDSLDGATIGGETQIYGQVTNDASVGKQAGTVEGAVVTAMQVRANGSTKPVEGETTTDAQGRYTLDVSSSSEVMIVTAQKADFRSQTLVIVERDGTTRAMPMTAETSAEAEVYVEARAESNTDADAVTVADVIIYVNSRTAAAIRSGATTAARVATAIRAEARAEAHYLDNQDEADEEEIDNVEREEQWAFISLQSSLNASSNVLAALEAFQEAYAKAYIRAGISAETQARVRQAGRAALLKFFSTSSTEARFALRKQAEIVTSLATTAAIQAAFEAEGTSESRIDALVTARTELITALRAARSESQLILAKAEYESTVQSVLKTEIGATTIAFISAETALTTARATLDTTVNTAASVEAVASAYASFHASTRAAIKSALSTSSNAELGAQVLVLLSAN